MNGSAAPRPHSRGRATARRQQVAEFILAEGSASARELAARFDASLMTIHRDLDALEQQGVVRRFRGGATAQPSSVFESTIEFRRRANPEEKEALGRDAAALIEPGMALLLDDSTTALAVVPHLAQITPLTVISNFVEVITALRHSDRHRLICIGGEYAPTHDSFLGVASLEALRSVRADLLIASTSAVFGGDVFHQEPEIVLVKRAMIESAARSVLLVDRNKLGRTALHRLGPVNDFDTVLVDDGARDEDLRALREHHQDIRLAEVA